MVERGFVMELVDYHVHSNCSCDGRSPILEMCQEAIGRGIVELGFSEHMDFDPQDLGEIYDTYFDEVSRSIESGLFDIIGHLDLIRKHTDKRALELNNLDYEERMRTILTEIIGNENYLEINTKLSVLERTCTETMPSREIVEDFVENGGRLISVGSDAHSKDEIGIGVEEQLSFLAKYEKCDLHLLFGQNQKN